MNNLCNTTLTPYAQKLRKEMTKEERKLWYLFLRTLPYVVKRQKVIGKYIVDFCIDSSKLIIELDGSGHYTESSEAKDKERDSYLRNLGYRILRFSNLDIQRRFQSVCTEIESRLVSQADE